VLDLKKTNVPLRNLPLLREYIILFEVCYLLDVQVKNKMFCSK